jgi:hypothetical protein
MGNGKIMRSQGLSMRGSHLEVLDIEVQVSIAIALPGERLPTYCCAYRTASGKFRAPL